MRLNLGCCDHKLPGFLGVDICPPADVIADLRKPWPWPDSSVDEIFARDIFEHLPDKIHTMNETWRVLKPCGRVEIIVPTTDGRGAWQDPTHVSYWTPNDLTYYSVNGFERKRLGDHYGIKALFRVVSQKHEELAGKVWKLTAVLEAAK